MNEIGAYYLLLLLIVTGVLLLLPLLLTYFLSYREKERTELLA